MVSASTVAFTALPISLFAPAAAFLVAFCAAASQYVSVPAGMALAADRFVEVEDAGDGERSQLARLDRCLVTR